MFLPDHITNCDGLIFFCGGRKRNINSNQQIFVLDDQNNIFTTHSKNACVGL